MIKYIKNENDFVQYYNYLENYCSSKDWDNSEDFQYQHFNMLTYYINNILYNEQENFSDYFNINNLDNYITLNYLIKTINKTKLKLIL